MKMPSYFDKSGDKSFSHGGKTFRFRHRLDVRQFSCRQVNSCWKQKQEKSAI